MPCDPRRTTVFNSVWLIQIISPRMDIASQPQSRCVLGSGHQECNLAVEKTSFFWNSRGSLKCNGRSSTDSRPTAELPLKQCLRRLGRHSLALLIGLMSCLGTSCGSKSPPSTSNGTVSPTSNPLTARYSITPGSDAKVTVEFGTDLSYEFRTSGVPTPPGGGKVDVIVAGMMASTTYHLRGIVAFSDGRKFIDADRLFTTGVPPADRVPNVSVAAASGLHTKRGCRILEPEHIWTCN